MRLRSYCIILAFTFCVGLRTVSFAEVKLPSVIGENMVLQRGQADSIWGWADADEDVTVEFNGQTKSTKAGDNGKWSVKLDPMRQGGPFEMTIKGKNVIKLGNIMIGDVWVCSGQSNMEWNVANSNNADTEIKEANYPNIRLITVPKASKNEPQDNFNGKWEACSPDTVKDFSAVGYFFGRKINQETGVAVGLIHSSWGGSSCETWINPTVVAQYQMYDAIMKRKAAADEKSPGGGDNQQAGYLYNGMIVPIKNFGIKGAIWYQGETNADRAYQYRTLFPLMIQNWREEWGQGDFPFYFVQLANFMDTQAEPDESAWAELREAQSMTAQTLRNTGEAVIIDIGDAKDIHPRNKQDVGLRLALISLARDRGPNMATAQGGQGGQRSQGRQEGEGNVQRPRAQAQAQRQGQGLAMSEGPRFRSMRINGNEAIISFQTQTARGLKAKDGSEIKGFAIAGADKKFYWADAKIERGTVVVSSSKVPNPVAVRYAWANNPVCNLYNGADLPAGPFRTDIWPGVTINNK